MKTEWWTNLQVAKISIKNISKKEVFILVFRVSVFSLSIFLHFCMFLSLLKCTFLLTLVKHKCIHTGYHHKMQVSITQEAFELPFESAVKLLKIHSKTSHSREAKNTRYKDYREVFAIFSFSFRQMNA